MSDKLPKTPKDYIRTTLKLQRPLFVGGAASPMVMYYNKDRSVEGFIPYDDDMEFLFGKDDKQYWIADCPNVAGNIKLVKKLEVQTW